MRESKLRSLLKPPCEGAGDPFERSGYAIPAPDLVEPPVMDRVGGALTP